MTQNNRRQAPLSRSAAKIQAAALRRQAEAEGRALSHQQALEEIARQAGFRNLHSMVSARKKAEGGTEVETTAETTGSLDLQCVPIGVDRTGTIPTEMLEAFAQEVQSLFDEHDAKKVPEVSLNVLDNLHPDVRAFIEHPMDFTFAPAAAKLWSWETHVRAMCTPFGGPTELSDFAYDTLVEALGQERADAHMAEHGLTRKKK